MRMSHMVDVATTTREDTLHRETLHFAAQVPIATTTILSRRVRYEAVVSSVRARIYAGAETTLRLRIYAQDERGIRRYLHTATEGSKSYIDGDDDWQEFAPLEPVSARRGDSIYVEAENTDAVNPHNFAVQVDLRRRDVAHGRWS